MSYAHVVFWLLLLWVSIPIYIYTAIYYVYVTPSGVAAVSYHYYIMYTFLFFVRIESVQTSYTPIHFWRKKTDYGLKLKKKIKEKRKTVHWDIVVGGVVKLWSDVLVSVCVCVCGREEKKNGYNKIPTKNGNRDNGSTRWQWRKMVFNRMDAFRSHTQKSPADCGRRWEVVEIFQKNFSLEQVCAPPPPPLSLLDKRTYRPCKNNNNGRTEAPSARYIYIIYGTSSVPNSSLSFTNAHTIYV